MMPLNASSPSQPLFIMAAFLGVVICGTIFYQTNQPVSETRIVLNPYSSVDWSSSGHYKAALHVHTLQSDGYHMLEDVVHAYRDAGFTILAITDHDWNYPNARVGWGHVPEEEASPYPKEPKPENFPANTTWPWTDYGGPAPEAVDMVGIEAAELTFRHHINSYFTDYGVWYERTGSEAPYGGIVNEENVEIWEDDQLFDIRESGGIAILDHPGLSQSHGFWDRKPLYWYIERFNTHSPDYLIGMEVTNTDRTADLQLRENYDEGLWDQLLAHFMPERPVWGFGTDDMHRLDDVRDSHTVFLLDEHTEEAVRDAMKTGQFYFTKSTLRLNFFDDKMSLFPSIESIFVDNDAGSISIEAGNYDTIHWISAPESADPINDYKTSDQPWPLGTIVHEGETIHYRDVQGINNYLRAEIIREEEGELYRTFTNPFGLINTD
ncbi:MAG: hypothetical protein JJU13_04745 [Balneolaceae bacterium]|nr:hypothetical protein [Balneolaceae bacterium]